MKTLLASLICYVFYHAVQWDGIHTSMITCALVANPNVGASSEKIVLRIGGAVLGGLLAFLLSLFVMPHIDTIVGLLITITPVFFVAGWIAAGPERTSYVGVQMVATFCLGFLGHFGPSTDLVEIRDRMIGILLGAVVAGLVYTLIWPESETGTLKRKLAEMIDRVGQLPSRPSQRGNAAWLGYLQQRMTCIAAMDACRAMRRRVSMEGQLDDGMRRSLLARSELAMVRSRSVVDDWDALVGHGAEDSTPWPSEDVLCAWQEEAGNWLRQYAKGLAGSVESGANAFPQQPLGVPEGSSAWLTRARRLADEINGLPEWPGAPGARP
ncbi:FUSC family protein [Dyella telluris]|uniref:FUSC family protein n=1 Tax=Dyella telluris TaxID=2763498 RepID=A0A7G8Q4T6_9GAMM|nr:FUSC family protein [Dyella telluris]QNK01794.1 FUSC family protein [Dyella telluris]